MWQYTTTALRADELEVGDRYWEAPSWHSEGVELEVAQVVHLLGVELEDGSRERLVALTFTDGSKATLVADELVEVLS